MAALSGVLLWWLLLSLRGTRRLLILQDEIGGADGSKSATSCRERSSSIASSCTAHSASRRARLDEDQVLHALHFILGAHIDHLVAHYEVELLNQFFRLLFHFGSGVVEHFVGEGQHKFVDLGRAAVIAHIV